MTDRELLELAAKAAGYKEYGMERVYFRHDCEFRDEFCVEDSTWNPLTDDGDALRLAVKLEINILPTMEEASARNPSYTAWINEDGRVDPYAATRRAIVRAAAEIGKGMQ